MNNTASPIKVGDTIEHLLVPGFRMEVLAVEPCGGASDHDQYKVIDPEGHEDWLCAHDVRKLGAWPTPSVMPRRVASPCPCECNRGGFCGGCGHAGCGGRRTGASALRFEGEG